MIDTKRFVKFLFITLLFVAVCVSHGNIPKVRWCGDDNCDSIISMAKTNIRYNSPHRHMVSFQPNKECRVLSKSADPDSPDLWEIEIQGQRGYANKKFIVEHRIKVRAADLKKVISQDETAATTEAERPADDPTSESATKEIDSALKPTEEQPTQKKLIEENSAEEFKSTEEKPIVEKEAIVTNEKPEKEEESGKEMNNQENLSDDVEVEVDEEDLLNEEYRGENAQDEPVDEPPFIKKEAYKTGDSSQNQLNDENADVKLGIIGLHNDDNATAPIENGKQEEIIPSSVNIESADDVLDVDATKIETEENINERTINMAENIEINPTTITPDIVETVVAPEVFTTIIEPESIPATETPSILDAADLAFDGKNATIDGISKLNIEPTESVEPVKVEATQITKNIELEHSSVEDTLTLATPSVFEDYGKDNETEEVETTTAQIEATTVSNDVLQTTLLVEESTTILPETSSIAPEYIPPVIPVYNSYQEHKIVEENSQETVPVETNSINDDLNAENPSKIVEPMYNYLNPSILSDRVKKSDPSVDEPPHIHEENVPHTHTHESSEIPEIVDEIQQNIPQENMPHENTPQETTSQEPENVVENDIFSTTTERNGQEEIPDIFTKDIEPEVQQPVNEENWYDGLLLSAQDAYGSILKLMDFSSKEQPSDEHLLAEEQTKPTNSYSDGVTDYVEDGYCERLEDGSCPKNLKAPSHHAVFADTITKIKAIDYDQFVDEFLRNMLAMTDLVICLALTATAILIFLLGHYCIVNNRREGALISKLNILERKLLTSEKECTIFKGDLVETRKKLASIADKSFGTDDMIKQIEREKTEMREQIAALEKELETATEAGLELNKMVSELLNNQSGSDSIISSVEELQHQLNEQEANTVYINNLLAEKCRENSELQVLITETNKKFGLEIEELLQLNEKLKGEKETIETELTERLENVKAELSDDLEAKTSELTKLSKEHADLVKKHDEITSRWHSASARAQALEDSIKKLKAIDGKADIKAVIEATDANAKIIALNRENEALKEKLDGEADARNLLEEHVKAINAEITRLRTEYNQNEKEKLEAQTRLEVLSSYFKEKEAQLQKELSVKEALFMKQQGESTSTVERIRSLQDEIQGLKSQNDELRAEIEAQSAAHKAQINAAESRAHDSWLAAKQAERRLEEARSEAGVLRKKLTSLTFNASGENSLPNHAIDGIIPSDINAPSPIHMESPASPPLISQIGQIGLPPPPFMPPPPPFMPNPGMIGNPPMNLPPFMPPPPLVSVPGELRPAPLGRLMSPPPPNHRFSPNNFDDRDRYGRFSPGQDSRYDDYPPDFDRYETETDFSPPRSPVPFERREHYHQRNYSPSPPPLQQTRKKHISKGALSSEESAPSQKNSRSGKL